MGYRLWITSKIRIFLQGLLDPMLRLNSIYFMLIRLPLSNPNLFRVRERCHRLRLKKRGIGGYLADTLITSPEKVSIGDRATFGGRVLIYGLGGVTIGNDCMVGYGSIIHTATHDPTIEIMNRVTKSKPIVVGNNVWVGTGAIILPGVELADGIIVGAGSVVTKSFSDPDVIIAGVPAKLLGNRKSAVTFKC